MTTHLRALGAQAGALLAMVGGFVALSASPAAADAPAVRITRVSSTSVQSGGKVQIEFTVTNTNQAPEGPGSDDVQINVSGPCTDGCSPQQAIGPGKTESFGAEFTAPQLRAGQPDQPVSFSVTATIGGESGNAGRSFTVKAPAGPQTVRQVSGRVRDNKGKAVSGATVVVQDSTGRRYDTQSNGDGNYSITSSDSKPIAAGNLTVVAGKEGYNPGSANVQGRAGQTVNVQLTMAAVAEPPPSRTPSTAASETTPALDETADEETPAAAAPSTTAVAGEDKSSGSLLYIILGALLVAAGLGAIVLVLMRRKKNVDDDPNGPVPPGRAGVGGYGEPVRVAAPVGARGNDATMIAGAGAVGDAPTVLQRAVPPDDEFPDPYGAPAQAGYGHQTQMYGAQPPAQPGGYYDDDGSDRNYYGGQQAAPQQRYDEPTGMYGQSPYADAGQQQPPAHTQSWDDASGYAPGGGYGNASGYDQAGYDQSGYDQRAGGYQQPGYDQQQGYAQPAGYDENDYGQQRGGYDQGYYDDGRGVPPRR